MSETGMTYWDSSAAVSTVVEDAHTRHAVAALRRDRRHVLSSLAHAEVVAVLSRQVNDGRLPASSASLLRAGFRFEPWSHINLEPDPALVEKLSRDHPLRGADLWHLAAAATLARRVPELRLLTYDHRLRSAAAAIGLAA